MGNPVVLHALNTTPWNIDLACLISGRVNSKARANSSQKAVKTLTFDLIIFTYQHFSLNHLAIQLLLPPIGLLHPVLLFYSLRLSNQVHQIRSFRSIPENSAPDPDPSPSLLTREFPVGDPPVHQPEGTNQVTVTRIRRLKISNCPEVSSTRKINVSTPTPA